MFTAIGKVQVNTVVLVTLKAAIKMYVKTGMKANRAYTPKNMLAKAEELTGRTYKRNELQVAHDDLQVMYDKIVSERNE